MTNGRQLEADVRDLLERAIPASTLSGVCLFQVDLFVEGRNFGTEIDHLLHFQAEDGDHLLLIECKAQPVSLRGGVSNDAFKEWIVTYDGEPKHLKKQLFGQSHALLQNLYPRERFDSVTVHAMVVSSDVATPTLRVESATGSGIYFYLTSFGALREALGDRTKLTSLFGIPPARWRPLRVQQSDLLRKVRHSLVLPELGHPEVPNGMRYVARCREVLDCELTRYFTPTSEGRWVINGGAGMGKTVLLAYAAVVFASDHVIVEQKADRQVPKRALVPWTSQQIVGKLPVPVRRRVVLVGLNHKQHEVLAQVVDRFAREYRHIAEQMDEPHLGTIPQPPRVEIWKPGMRLNADVLLIDEAHDLTLDAQTQVREWWQKGEGKRYLVLACDRHQKLRLLGDHATILEGLSFAGCSRRLKRNYRSPSAIYAASLALMFRWFGNGGAKILPTQSALESEFGFAFGENEKIADQPGAEVVLRLQSDVHPANYWCFTVARYTHWRVAANWLEEWGLNEEQVLWVRFSHTDHELAQQDLKRVQLRDLMVRDPDHVIDAHIKGREFPVVIIEGLPDEGVDQDKQAEMLLWRRRLYLCASRATCFLFFVYPSPDGSPPSRAWNEELSNLLRSCSAPKNRTESSSKFWEFRFGFPTKLLRPEVFADLESAPKSSGSAPLPPSAPASPIEDVTVSVTPPPPSPAQAPAVSPPVTVALEPVPAPPAPAPAPVSSVITAPPTTAEPKPLPPSVQAVLDDAAKKMVQMSEKEFQRLYGQEKGWKQLYALYRQTGALPAYLKPAGKPGTLASPDKRAPQASTLARQPTPPAKPTPPRERPFEITPRMISRQLNVLPFRVLKTAMGVFRAEGIPHLPGLDMPLSTKQVHEIYRAFETPSPGRTVWDEIRRQTYTE